MRSRRFYWFAAVLLGSGLGSTPPIEGHQRIEKKTFECGFREVRLSQKGLFVNAQAVELQGAGFGGPETRAAGARPAAVGLWCCPRMSIKGNGARSRLIWMESSKPRISLA